jgi:hypothetical protein
MERPRFVARSAGGLAALFLALVVVTALVVPAFAESQASTHQTSGTAGTSGTVTSPQPSSNADNNGVGANQPGPYDSTRNGAPSLNGSGNGQATGRPCAGCVGRADNKNPFGQFPNGSDPNAGYECDRNHGVGQTNPAHTGCATTPGGPGVSGPPGGPGSAVSGGVEVQGAEVTRAVTAGSAPAAAVVVQPRLTA